MEKSTPETTNRLSCRRAIEILPWLINGSLADDERPQLGEHLASCASCRRELEDTALVWSMATQHLPSLILAEYAQGLTPSGMERERIERHLAHCPSCSAELEWAMSAEVTELDPARVRRAARARQQTWGSGLFARRSRLFAAAASIVLALASGWWIRSFNGGESVAVDTAAGVEASFDSEERRSQAPQRGAVVLIDGFESGDVEAWVTVSQ